jgi:hypothetical protein
MKMMYEEWNKEEENAYEEEERERMRMKRKRIIRTIKKKSPKK